MDESAALAVRILFWALAALAGVLPFRWSLLAFILATHVDVTSATFESATTVGFENAVKTVLLPTVLFLRFCSFKRLRISWNWPLVLWVLLVVWASVSLLWSPFQISGLKMVGYMYSYVVLCGLFVEGWCRDAIRPSVLALALWLSLGLAALQTWGFDNPFGRSPVGLNDDRFTSFCTPQLFAAFLLAIISVLLISQRVSTLGKIVHGTAATVGLALCGSRYVFLGAIAMAVVIGLSQAIRDSSSLRESHRFAGGMAAVVCLIVGAGVFLDQKPSNRIGELIAVLWRGESPMDTMGTLVWRKGIYQQALSRLADREPVELALGSGTSSGASIVLGYDLRYSENSVDANRVVHNELLRALWEWGIFGFLLFAGVLITLARMFFRWAVIQRIYPAFAFLSLLPTVFLGCLSENILAGSGSPAGVGILLSLTYGVAYWERKTTRAAQRVSLRIA